MRFLSAIQTVKDSKKLSIVLVLIMMGSFGIYSIPITLAPDAYPDYYLVEKPYLDSCSLFKFPHLNYQVNGTTWNEDARNPLNWYMDCAGKTIFHNENILPTLFSIGIIGMTYLISYSISGHRFVGLIASFVLMFNYLFYDWSSSVTYDQGWALFLLIGIWLAYREVIISPLPFVASILAKALTITYLPMFLYTIYKTEHERQVKISIGIISIIIVSSLFVIAYLTTGFGAKFGLHPEGLILGLERTFGIISWDLPILFGFIAIELMFRKFAQPIKGKDVCSIWMGGICIISIITYLFSGQFQFVYRFVPFAVFMSIYIGIILTRVIYCFEYIAKKRLELKSL